MHQQQQQQETCLIRIHAYELAFDLFLSHKKFLLISALILVQLTLEPPPPNTTYLVLQTAGDCVNGNNRRPMVMIRFKLRLSIQVSVIAGSCIKSFGQLLISYCVSCYIFSTINLTIRSNTNSSRLFFHRFISFLIFPSIKERLTLIGKLFT